MPETVSLSELIGVWTAAFLTLCIFSFLYKDNFFYKLAEHVFIGVSAAYWMAITYWDVIEVNLLNNLRQGDLWYLIPLVAGVVLLLRLVPGISWVSRWPLAFMVGISAGYNIVLTMSAQVLKQVYASLVPLWGNLLPPDEYLRNWILVFGVITGLLYFYFSVEHKGLVFGWAARVGIWVLMIAFGAGFGYTVMARVSLLIGRVLFFKEEFWPLTRTFFGGG